MILTAIRVDGDARVAVRHGSAVHPLEFPDIAVLLREPSWRDLAEAALAEPPATAWTPAMLVSPAKILCCGVNYLDHIAEMGRERPAFQTLFAKFADSLICDGEDIPLTGSGTVQLDWEAELAVIVGAELRRADREEAAAGIAGYTVANDISARDWQGRTTQFLQGKAWDAMTPVGPAMVTADAFDPAAGAVIECRIDGEVMQRSTTDQLLFDTPAILSYISEFTTLRPGDLVLTGTPGGVGAGRTPPTFLAPGMLLETSIEGIGTLRNRIV